MSWQPINTAPDGETVVVGWISEGGFECYDFDICDEGLWIGHESAREHFLAVASPGDTGPGVDPPYTHWMSIEKLPANAQRQESYPSQHVLGPIRRDVH